MAKNYGCIINVGSSTVSLTGIILDNQNPGRCFYKSYRHDGIKNNFFKNPEKLFIAIRNLIELYIDTIGKNIRDAYVILPERFFRFKQNKMTIPILSGVVNKFDVDDLIQKSVADIEDCEILNCIPIAYRTHEDYIDNPIGQNCAELELISVSEGLLVRIVEFFTDISKRLGLQFEYISEIRPILTELQHTTGLRRSPRIVVNFDHDCIDVCYCEMCAVIAVKTIDLGHDDFVNLLMHICKSDYETASELFSHVNFNVTEGNYVVGGAQPKVWAVKTINENLMELYGHVAEKIDKAITDLTESGAYPIYMVGQFACSIRGAAKVLSDKIKMGVTVLCPDLLLWNKPSDYCIVGLIEDICRRQ